MDTKLLGEKRTLLVRIGAELDHHSAGKIREEADGMLRSTNAVNIIFDFTKTEFMDSSGIGMLMGRYKKVHLLGGRVVAFGVNAQLLRILKMSGVDKIVKLAPDFERAKRLVEK